MTLSLSRLTGANSALAFKAPVRVASTANLTLSGWQTIDGVALADGDANLRVLVKNQTDDTENGLYDVKSGAWSRCGDFNSGSAFVYGTRIPVRSGTVSGGLEYIVATEPDTNFRIDLTSIAFAVAPVTAPQYTVATLPAGAAGRIAFATNGRKNGEGAGLGTGVLCFHDGTAWRACDTGATAAA